MMPLFIIPFLSAFICVPVKRTPQRGMEKKVLKRMYLWLEMGFIGVYRRSSAANLFLTFGVDLIRVYLCLSVA